MKKQDFAKWLGWVEEKNCFFKEKMDFWPFQKGLVSLKGCVKVAHNLVHWAQFLFKSGENRYRTHVAWEINDGWVFEPIRLTYGPWLSHIMSKITVFLASSWQKCGLTTTIMNILGTFLHWRGPTYGATYHQTNRVGGSIYLWLEGWQYDPSKHPKMGSMAMDPAS